MKATRLAYHTVPMRMGDVALTRLSLLCSKGDVEGTARLLTQSRIHGGEELVRVTSVTSVTPVTGGEKLVHDRPLAVEYVTHVTCVT